MGSCGWIRCTPNCVLSHVVQDMVRFWFGAVGGQSAQILGPFGAFLGALGGHIVELEGPRGLFGTGNSSCMCRVAIISLHLAVFSRF